MVVAYLFSNKHTVLGGETSSSEGGLTNSREGAGQTQGGKPHRDPREQ